MKFDRRFAIQVAVVSASGILATAGENDERPTTSLGLCQYCAKFARAQAKEVHGVDLYQPEQFFQHIRQFGAGGYQVELGILDQSRSFALRRQAEAAGIYIEGIVRAPKTRADLDRFDAEMKSAAAVGAPAVRSTIFTGRRYEYFRSLEKYREHDIQSRRSLELAAPIAEKYRVAFAPENHKDHRVEERIDVLQKISSEYVGVCVDTGNNFALLEDPVETARRLAPWARSVHIKDQAVQSTNDGFLFGDIPLGQGFIDLKQIVVILKSARPTLNFTLELLTRDPLRVPCLTPDYWRTFPDLPAVDLAKTLRTVRENEAGALQYPSELSPDQQLALESSNVVESIRYARNELGLAYRSE